MSGDIPLINPGCGHAPGEPFTFVPEAPTLRDHFAIAALTAIAATDFWANVDDLAKMAYQIADAMLETRK